MLAVFTVSELTDSPVVAAGDAPGTLRQALFDANSAVGADTIDFQNGLTGTITLNSGELTITDQVSIVGPGATQLTIDATGNDLISPGTADGSGSRVLNIDDGNVFVDIAVEISGLTLTGGDVSGSGGGIRSLESLTLSQARVVANSATSAAARGGGIFNFGGNLSIDRSTISGNAAIGTSADGGGIFSESKVLGAQTTSITDSTISGNQASRNGGGINTRNNLSQDQNTIVVNSTVSGNSAAGAGGGIYNFDGTTTLNHSTVSNNSAASGWGGGVASYGDLSTLTSVHSSIISGNSGDDVAVHSGDVNSLQSSGFNVVGTGNNFGPANLDSALDNFGMTGDQTGVLNPGLLPLANNGGPTQTHALLPTSPALDAGDPAAQAGLGDVPQFDQRLAPFGRVRDGNNDTVVRIDVGAFELAGATPSTSADFDQDGDVDGNDFLSWQRGFGTASGAGPEDGDADGNGSVDAADLVVWESTFGDMPTALVAAQQSVQVNQQFISPAMVEGDISGDDLSNLAGLAANSTHSVSTQRNLSSIDTGLLVAREVAIASEAPSLVKSGPLVQSGPLVKSGLAPSAFVEVVAVADVIDDGNLNRAAADFEIVDELFRDLETVDLQPNVFGL